MANKKRRLEKGDIVEVTWLDAYGEIGLSKSQLESDQSPSSYLVKVKTYGKYFAEDSKAILILEEDSESAADICAIPKPWVVKILKLNGGNKT